MLLAPLLCVFGTPCGELFAAQYCCQPPNIDPSTQQPAGCAPDGVADDEVAPWGELFVSMKDFFYVSLCDEELCDGAVEIFESFLSFLPAATVIKTFPTLLSSLLMIFPGGEAVCQQAALTFLDGVRERGGEFAAEIANLAQSFPAELMAVPELAALA